MATIRKRGMKWEVQIRRAGFPSSTKTFLAHADALRWSRERERSLDRGVCPTAITAPENRLSDLLDRYEAEISIHKRSPSDHFHIRQIKRHSVASCRMVDLNPSRVAQFRNDRLKHVAPATVIKEMTILRHVVALGIQEWGLDPSLAMICKVRNPAPPRGRNKRLDEDQLSGLLCQLRALKNPLIIDVVEFAIETAMRRGELLALCWHEVDIPNRSANIKLSKNGEGRVVPLTPNALVILERVRSRSTVVDANSKVFQLAPAALRMAWVRALDRLQISDFRFHDLRHEAISRFFELGLSIPEVALISGHRDVRMLFRYTHLKPSNVMKKLWRLDQSGFGVRDLISSNG